MSLQQMDFPFAASIDESTSSKVLPQPALVKATNLWRTKQGELNKRPGTTQLATGEEGPEGPKKVIERNGSIIAIDSDFAWAYTAEDSWRRLEDSCSATLDGRKPIGVYAHHQVVATAIAATEQMVVYAWCIAGDTGEILHISVEEIGGAVVTPVTAVDGEGVGNVGMRTVKAVRIGTSNVLVAWGTTENRIKAIIVTPNHEGGYISGDAVTLATDADQSGLNWFDLDRHNSGQVVLAYVTTADPGIVQCKRLSATLSQLATAQHGAADDHPKVGIVGRVNNIHLHLQNDGANSAEPAFHNVIRLNDSLADVAHSAYTSDPSLYSPLGISTGRYSSTQSIWIRNGSTGSIVGTTTVTTPTGEWSSLLMPSWSAVTKPWVRGDRIHWAGQYYTSTANSHSALLSISPETQAYPIPRVEARVTTSRVPQQVSDPAACIGIPYEDLPATDYRAHTRYLVPLRSLDRISGPTQVKSATAAAQVLESVRFDAFDFNLKSSRQYGSAELGSSLYLGGGIVSQFDGQRLTDLGFGAFPDVSSADIAVSSGGNLADGSYNYAFCWEWYDAQGERHQSAAKIIPVVVSQSNLGKVTINTPAWLSTRKIWRLGGSDQRLVVCAIYRTLPNGAILYRLEGPNIDPFPQTTIQGGQFVDTYNHTSNLAASREILYTSQGGAQELDNVPPPPSKVLCAHQGRLFGTNDESGDSLWFSKSHNTGFGIATNESLSVQLDEKPIALASQDSNLLVFSRGSIYTVLGQATNNTGVSTSYEAPQRLSAEVGCVDPRSLVTAPGGIYFQSERGIYFLSRGGVDPLFIGAQVEDTLAAYPVITAAVHDTAHTRVVWAVATEDGPSASSRLLVYDYLHREWFVWTYGDDFLISSLALKAGKLVICSPGSSGEDHFVAIEDDGYDDDHNGVNTFIDTTLETGDIRIGGLSGLSGISFVTPLGQAHGISTFQLAESHDSGSTWTHSKSWDVTAPEVEFYRRYQTKKRKSSAVRFRITQEQVENIGTVEVPVAGPTDSRGVSMHGMTLEVTSIRRAKRLEAAKR